MNNQLTRIQLTYFTKEHDFPITRMYTEALFSYYINYIVHNDKLCIYIYVYRRKLRILTNCSIMYAWYRGIPLVAYSHVNLIW